MSQEMIELLFKGTGETLYMVLVSSAFAYLIGIPLGVLVYVTDTNSICRNRGINLAVGGIINLVRSIPFLILLVAILPFTRWVVGTSIGSTATIVPLVAAAAPYVARMVESSLKEVNEGVIEAAQAMGSSVFQIICKVLLPEAMPSLVVGVTISLATILGYSAMAGTVGGGGLGDIAIRYGYHRYEAGIMAVTVVLLILLVQIFQTVGMKLSVCLDRRK